ncbi:MAG: hypothetical protein HY903_11330 [Deltaproteobacteria bacterium]|nr:hypothetical protein [Deltaproteobacteria bacterium]
MGYLAWAACGKDPGYSPAKILCEARRSSHYSAVEVQQLSYAGAGPDAAALAARWHELLVQADAVIDALPATELGRCVLDARGELFRGDGAEAQQAIARGELRFHAGRIGGALPVVVGAQRP